MPVSITPKSNSQESVTICEYVEIKWCPPLRCCSQQVIEVQALGVQHGNTSRKSGETISLVAGDILCICSILDMSNWKHW